MHRALPILLTMAAMLATSAPAQDTLDSERHDLAEAKAAAAAAATRAAALDRSASAERNAAKRAQRQEDAVAARIARAEADIAAARARVAIVSALLGRQRADLSRRQGPAARLLGALQSMTRRPTVLAIAQPGSVDEVVHVRAALGTVLPVVRARTADLRAGLAETRKLEGDALLAATSLRDGRSALVRERRSLAELRQRHAGRATALGRNALIESDRAIALGESARDIVDRMADFGDRSQTIAALERLPGPPRFDPSPAIPSAYRLPVAGRLVTGFGEVSESGVRARGLTFAVTPNARVVAPAAGRIVFARPFRRYGTTIIIDHGGGWITAITGLARAQVAVGAQITAGGLIGAAAAGDAAAVTVELYRRNRPVDIAGLL